MLINNIFPFFQKIENNVNKWHISAYFSKSIDFGTVLGAEMNSA